MLRTQRLFVHPNPFVRSPGIRKSRPAFAPLYFPFFSRSARKFGRANEAR